MCSVKNGRTVPCWMETERRKDQANRRLQEAGQPLSPEALKRMISDVFGEPTSPEDARIQAVNTTIRVVQEKMAKLSADMPEDNRRARWARSAWVAYYLAAVLPSDVAGMAIVDLAHEVGALRETIEAKERALKTLREENRKAYARINDLSRPLGIRPSRRGPFEGV